MNSTLIGCSICAISSTSSFRQKIFFYFFNISLKSFQRFPRKTFERSSQQQPVHPKALSVGKVGTFLRIVFKSISIYLAIGPKPTGHPSVDSAETVVG
jgi:hypothetical protein